ncbi:MAG: hypothetical protein HETSPECPRED_001103 [Heterodermia speciosa]|uniref:CFEM domain-containing protein n=1 Tax=Heterodermia speciosa TaxID=116794 RepID=A0A8H3J0M8_9LECA|nr:MAG: hypothetical protein HETSPECPRED_001103 [Heterodermia speciosa]
MRSHIALLTLLAVGIKCVTINDFPQCAQTCISRAAVQTGGNSTNLSFVCKSNDFLTSTESCEAASCSPPDLIQVFTRAVQLCEPVGGTVHIGLFNLSACAQPGLATAKAQSGCSDTDWTCICSSPAFTTGAARYEEQHCSLADRQAIYSFTKLTCAAVGIQFASSSSNSSNITSPTVCADHSARTQNVCASTGSLPPAFTGDSFPRYVRSSALHYVAGMIGWLLWMRYMEG